MNQKQTCTECLMDTSDSTITFNEKGVCSYCQKWRAHPEAYGKIPEPLYVWINEVLPKIKATGKNKKYDCIIGVSGGVDSSYVSYIAQNYNLRALLVHASTGFDSDMATRNLDRVVKNTGFDIVYPAVDEEEFKRVQRAYLYASVLDTDVPADYLIEAFIRLTARKHKVSYVLSGGNYYADAFMPTVWNYPDKMDYVNLKNIAHAYGATIKSFPKYGAFQVVWNRYFHNLHYITPLNYVGYNRAEAMKFLGKIWGYEDYGEKHGENIFTRFYQRYILPEKFGVDKRRMNLSNYIRSGGLTRTEAEIELAKPRYDPATFEADKKFILNKLCLTEADLEFIMSKPPVPHSQFGSDQWIYGPEKFYYSMRRTAKKILVHMGVMSNKT